MMFDTPPRVAHAMTRSVCLRAAELVELGWTQGEFACDRADNAVSPTDAQACRWCLEGSLRAAAAELQLSALVLSTIIHWVTRQPGPREAAGLARWNDAPDRTAAEVAALLRRGAEEAPDR